MRQQHGTETSSGKSFYTFRFSKKELGFLASSLLFISLLTFSLGIMLGKELNHPGEGSSEGEKKPLSITFAGRAAQEKLSHEEESRKEKKGELTFFATLPDSEETRQKVAAQGEVSEQKRGEAVHTLTSAKPEAAEKREKLLSVKGEKSSQDQLSKEPLKDRSLGKDRKGLLVSTASALETSGSLLSAISSEYSIQVGAFKGLEGAETLRLRLRGRGYEAYISTSDMAGKGMWHRVRIGRYKSKTDAENMAQKIRLDENLPTSVTSRADERMFN